ncbi:MAG: hypothetical protein JNL54_16215 [Kineosporiaceae bacterium]|nr:hypothetical protein [Kineosporiaceae bacterium]
MAQQIESHRLTLGEITHSEDRERNLAENAIPAGLAEVTAASYLEFLDQRRKLMADVIRRYFDQL